MNYHIMLVSDVNSLVESNAWDYHYTTDDSQKSDDGVYMWVVGKTDSAIKSFDTPSDMLEWCYSSGWSRGGDEDI